MRFLTVRLVQVGILWFSTLAAACSSVIDASFSAEGTYQLAMYNGATVPARLFPLPPSPSNHQSSGCWYVAARGSLVLQGGHFRYSEAFEDSCTNAVLFEGEIGGNYAQDGRNLSFTVPGLGTVGTFTGTADGRDVTIRPDEDERTYRKLQ